MKKILLIGGTSLIGKCIIDTAQCRIDHPTRDIVDLKDFSTMSSFNYNEYDCLILVAGAGMRHGRDISFEKMDEDYIKDTIDVNCTGATFLLQKYLHHNPKGCIAVIGSGAIYKTETPNVVYTASKVYLDRMIDILENTYPDTFFIRVNPSKVTSRVEHQNWYIDPKDVANGVWHCIQNNIKKLDISYPRNK
jgi:short-subunit dehydrogenase|tara:strand:+ start:120 stop:695 length:576 start_codon:yes stop_codon:yes gene_type:complete